MAMASTLDTSSRRGRHVAARLDSDVIAWLTTVRPSGRPDSVPVWFIWHSGELVLYSRPRTTKLRNLAANPLVSITLDDTNRGADIVRIEGTARVDDTYPPAHRIPAYATKYAERIRAIGYRDPEAFARAYSVPIVVTVTRWRI